MVEKVVLRVYPAKVDTAFLPPRAGFGVCR
jgi:hypothetical protein